MTTQAAAEYLVQLGLAEPAAVRPGEPAEIVAAINKAVNAAHADPAVKEKLAKVGSVPMPGTPEEFGAFIERERELWLPVVKETGAKAE